VQVNQSGKDMGRSAKWGGKSSHISWLCLIALRL